MCLDSLYRPYILLLLPSPPFFTTTTPMSVPRRRPPSSAARPTTSAAGRPTTAAGFSQSFPPQYFGNTHYELDYEEEYEDESEDEDVFAFLPPTTADQEAATAAAAAAASAGAAGSTQPVAGSSTDALLMGGHSPYAVGGAGTMPAALGYQPSPASTSSSSPFSHSPFATTTDPPKRTSSLSPTSIPLDSTAPHPIPTYPDPTFDPWSRPAGAIPSSSAVSPYSHVQLASNNPYSPTNPYASTSNPYSGRPPTAYPLSPPSPSTDSHPSTGVSGMTTGQELFKLKRLTSAGGARVEEDPEPEEQIGVEERERESGREGVIRDREAKEVRVNLPVLAGAKTAQDQDESGARSVARARRKSTANNDDDDAKSPLGTEDDNDDDDGDESGEADEENTASPDGTKSKRSRKRRQRSKKTKSKISTSTDGRGSEDVVGATTTGVNPHVGFVSPNAPLTAAAAPRSVGVGVPDTPGTAERGLNSAHGVGQRMKNPNAQPYYAYAAMANAYGRGGFFFPYYYYLFEIYN